MVAGRFAFVSLVILLGVAPLACSRGRDSPRAGPTGGPSVVGVSTGEGGAGASSGAGGAGGDDDPRPPEVFLPTPSSVCPALVDGLVAFTYDGKIRNVELRLSLNAAQAGDGPVVFLWHGLITGSAPQAFDLLGSVDLDEILSRGGVAVAPYADPTVATLWHHATGEADALDDDLRLADEVLACLIEGLGVDTRQIHTVGFGEGGLQAAQFAARRSGYVASAVVHSGGLFGIPVEQDASNAYAVMVSHGGPGDIGTFEFGEASELYVEALLSPSAVPFASPHFTVLCDHGGGHVADALSIDAGWTFLDAHPYGTVEAYTSLPSAFPSSCVIP